MNNLVITCVNFFANKSISVSKKTIIVLLTFVGLITIDLILGFSELFINSFRYEQILLISEMLSQSTISEDFKIELLKEQQTLIAYKHYSYYLFNFERVLPHINFDFKNYNSILYFSSTVGIYSVIHALILFQLYKTITIKRFWRLFFAEVVFIGAALINIYFLMWLFSFIPIIYGNWIYNYILNIVLQVILVIINYYVITKSDFLKS